jgi:hypothetical protein
MAGSIGDGAPSEESLHRLLDVVAPGGRVVRVDRLAGS